ncbi:valine--tRNA ligase [Nanoarchaeota archaeon]
MDKRWSINKEKDISENWKTKDLFPVDLKSKKIYSIDTPPPYVNAPVHIGQAITYCYMDFFARYKRMKGYSVVFPLGLDRNGLPIEMAAEKKFKVNPLEIGREKFIEYCKRILEESSAESTDTFARLGISFSSYKIGDKIGQGYETDSEQYRTLTQSTFYDLWEKGLIYEDKKVVNYCPGCSTTLADAEIEYIESNKKLHYLKFKIRDSKKTLSIATTRPELLGACAAVLYNPKDERYKNLKNKKLIIPFYHKEVSLIAHNSAKPEFGTGLVMMCSFGDLTDIQFFREQNLKPVILINKDGKLNEKAGELLEGLKPDKAREKIIEKIKKAGEYEKEEETPSRVPVCERSKDQVEFIEMQEFYLRQVKFKKDLMNLQKKIKFYDESSRKILETWIKGINQDWPLSRRRYYATPIPLWKCPECGEFILGEKGKYVVPWEEKRECSKCKTEAVAETRVFDTWMDSSISELYILGYGRNETFFRNSFPCSLRPQGKEIIRTWLYYTLLRAYLLEKKPAFKDVWINYHILDGNRKKMSKSKGNIIDPQEIIKNEGAEALRFWSAIEGDLSKQDFACSREKIKAEIKTLNKLWNVAKFVLQFKEVAKPTKLVETDKLFIDYVEYLTGFCEDNYEKYNFHLPALKLRHFIWEVFASHYIELTKNRTYNQENKFSKQEQQSAHYTLRYIFERLLTLLYPITPMITSEIYSELGKNLLKENFPKPQKVSKEKIKIINELVNFNSKVWKTKKEKSISLRDEITGIKIPKQLKQFEKDLIICHSLR